MSNTEAQVSQQFTRELVIRPAYDKRAEGYGQHCVEMCWYLHGEKGVIQFVLFTGWYLSIIGKPSTDWQELHSGRYQASWDDTNKPMPADLGYHSPVPMYEGQAKLTCHLLPAGECYYDGSGLNAYRIFAVLVHEGGDAVWRALEAEYALRFEQEVPH